MTIYKRISACILCFVLLLAMAAPVYAAESCTLIIRYEHEGTPVAGAAFQIYRVGDGGENGVVLTGDFAGYPVDASDDLAQLAMTLYGFATLDSLSPTAYVTTDAYGVAVVEGLEKGVYLVAGTTHSVDGTSYVCQSQLIYLPWRASDAEEWNYEVTMRPKGTALSQELHTLKVLKVWEGQGGEAYRPQSIQVTLLQNGKHYDTVTLNTENNWRHTWEELPGGSFWQVVEQVPERFTTVSRKEGVTWVITNTCDEPPPPPPPDEPELPQTGMLWWPVPVLMVAGMLLTVAGIRLRRGDGYEEE